MDYLSIFLWSIYVLPFDHLVYLVSIIENYGCGNTGERRGRFYVFFGGKPYSCRVKTVGGGQALCVPWFSTRLRGRKDQHTEPSPVFSALNRPLVFSSPCSCFWDFRSVQITAGQFENAENNRPLSSLFRHRPKSKDRQSQHGAFPYLP